MQWFLCGLPEDKLQNLQFHVNYDMSVIRSTDNNLGKVKYAALILMNSGSYKRSHWCDTIAITAELTFRSAKYKFLPSRQKLLNDLRFEIPLLLT